MLGSIIQHGKLAGAQTAPSCQAGGVGGVADDHVQHAAVEDEFRGALRSIVCLEHLAGGRIQRRHRRAVAGRAVHDVADGRQPPLQLDGGVLGVDVHRVPVRKRPLPERDTVEGVPRHQRELARQGGVLGAA